MKHVIVVGGGISGLATAWFLRHFGVEVTVLEALGEPGGTIHTIEREGFLVDTGPTSALYRGGVLGELIKGLRLEGELVEANRRAKRYIVKNNQLNPLPMGLFDFLSTPLFSARAKWRLFAEPFYDRAGKEESIADFVRRRIGQEFLDWAVDPFVSGVFAGDPEKLSVSAAIPRLHALETEYASLFLGALARAFGGNGGGAQPRGRLISFRRGMQTLPRTIARDLAGALQLNAPVTTMERVPNGEWFVRTPSNNYRGSAVVLATAAPPAARLLAPLASELARELEAIDYPPVAVVALGFKSEQIQHPLDGFGALIPRRAERETLGVIFSSSLFPGRAPSGMTLLTAFIGGAHNKNIREREETALTQQVLEDLRSLIGIQGDPIFHYVALWPQAIPQYELGHERRIARIQALLSPFPGLHLQANWRGGVSLADSVTRAEELARRIAGE